MSACRWGSHFCCCSMCSSVTEECPLSVFYMLGLETPLGTGQSAGFGARSRRACVPGLDPQGVSCGTAGKQLHLADPQFPTQSGKGRTPNTPARQVPCAREGSLCVLPGNQAGSPHWVVRGPSLEQWPEDMGLVSGSWRQRRRVTAGDSRKTAGIAVHSDHRGAAGGMVWTGTLPHWPCPSPVVWPGPPCCFCLPLSLPLCLSCVLLVRTGCRAGYAQPGSGPWSGTLWSEHRQGATDTLAQVGDKAQDMWRERATWTCLRKAQLLGALLVPGIYSKVLSLNLASSHLKRKILRQLAS